MDRIELPVNPSNRRAPVWWGMCMLLVIEATVFGSLIVSYFFLRAHSHTWPQGDISPPDLTLPIVNVFVLLASSLPVAWADHGIRRGRVWRMRLGLGAGMALAVLFLALKVVEYSSLDYSWSTNAYGSIVWTITGLHTGHVVSLLLKTTVVIYFSTRGYFTERRNIGVRVNGLYWHFVVVAWLPLFATLYLSPRFL